MGPFGCDENENEVSPEPLIPASVPAPAPSPVRSESPAVDAILPSEAVQTIPWQAAGDYLDQEVFVIGKVTATGSSKTGHVFLNFDKRDKDSLTLFIHQDSVANFPEPPQNAYRDKMVKAHGFVYDYNGKPNLSVKSPADITILPEDTPLPTASQPAATPAARPRVAGTITLASYNVLNLFDAHDDPYSGDAASDSKPRAQLEALARSIRALDADVVALQEVENRGYLQRFVKAMLRDMGYEVVVFEGNDNRGIDVAVLSRLPIGPVTSHRHVEFSDPNNNPMRFRRDLLQVRVEPEGATPFDVYVVHLKSKGGEAEGGADTRMGEARAINRLLTDRLKDGSQARFVICGDFNDTIDSEPIQTIVGKGDLGLVTFIKDLPEDGRVSYNQPPYLSMIDFIFASPAMAAQYVPGSYRIIGGGSPETTGSDHNPLVAQFKVN
jgi:endonuclease/exonuclease/phosphatase family metal-dependent hydrolase